MNTSFKKWLYIIFGLLALSSVFLIVFYFQSRREKSKVDIPATAIDQTAIFNHQNSGTKTEQTPIVEEKPTIPAKYLLKVDFQSQAPYGDWSQPYQDACEEAAIIIVEHYYSQQSLTKEVMKNQIDASVAWQNENWGGHHDLPADQILKLAKDYFHLNGEVVRNYSLDDLKAIIASGKPILVPTAGRRLGNPNFTGAGPEYHNIVIIGYDDSQASEGDPLGGIFITNDPGTRKGESYIYKYQTVLSAISGPNENMEKAIVVLTK